MSISANQLKTPITQYCSEIGKDPLLVQGAGGNVSWKDKNVLWIKASGMWMSEALVKDIFVPVCLVQLRDALNRNDFAVVPKVLQGSILRPSIETLLHALMPHNVVLHLHAVEVLAYLVRDNWQDEFHSKFGNLISWTSVDYKKPGIELAAAVVLALKATGNVNVMFLQNHGLVIGGKDIEEVDNLLKIIIDEIKILPDPYFSDNSQLKPISLNEQILYYPVSDKDIHRLAIDEVFFNNLECNWALYPDHVVFLGAKPYKYDNTEVLMNELQNYNEKPDLVFIKGMGVFVRPDFNSTQNAQLSCYYNILIRQNKKNTMKVLAPWQINELLNLNAEQHRIELAKTKTS